MKALSFGFCDAPSAGRRVRAARFEERSLLPATAVCVVAATMRETLSMLWGSPVSARLLEPVIPSSKAWCAIVAGADLFIVRGAAADAAIVLRRPDALALASAAFGESVAAAAVDRDLSPIERDVVNRSIAAIAGALAPVCGARDGEGVVRTATIDGFATYFEVVLDRPVDARIGVALSRDPAPEPHGTLRAGDLDDLELAGVVALDVGKVEAGAIAGLVPGAIVPITRSGAFRGSLAIGGRTLAQGTCGVRNGRYALEIER